MLFYRMVVTTACLIVSAAAVAIDTRFLRRDSSLQRRAYTGNGSPQAGWPEIYQWKDFENLWILNEPTMRYSCAQWGVPNNSDIEVKNIRKAIELVARQIGLDSRFILAVVMQESKGCVRVPTTRNAVANPGLMQTHAGTGTCNSNGVVTNPCEYAMIERMILEGSAGTSVTGPTALKPLLLQAGDTNKAMSYYRAARAYNSGSLPASGQLENGLGATNSYASDIAYRLTGALYT